jgi:hypothetical protein
MAKVYKYEAQSNGTLNHPYRFVTLGEIVESPIPLDVRWLLPLKDADALKPLPIMASMPAPTPSEEVAVAPVAQRIAYDEQMATLIAKEAAQDGKLPLDSTPAPETTQE